jgi:hypothetical protein
VVGSCEHGNEPSGSIKGEEFLEQLLVLSAFSHYNNYKNNNYNNDIMGDFVVYSPYLVVLVY